VSILAKIQSLGANRLLSDVEFFAPISVVTEREKSLATVIDTALGQVGLCVAVLTPRFSVEHVNTPGPYFDDITIMARVWEMVPVNEITNPDGPTGLDVCERIVFLWHQFRAHLICEAWVEAKPTIVLSPVKQENVVAYDVLFKTKAPGTKTHTLTAPQIVIAAGMLRLSCNNAGVTIYYTLDGEYPSPANPSAQVYTEPVVVSSVLVTACAYKAGCFPSSLNMHWAPFVPPPSGQFFTDSTGKHFTT
jgi:Chitobiase/beta-hexosaminidase C-terminal domain